MPHGKIQDNASSYIDSKPGPVATLPELTDPNAELAEGWGDCSSRNCPSRNHIRALCVSV